MVFQKRVGCAPNGFHIPAMPRVPRSAKGKRSSRKKVEGNQMSAFDLLASLAGKLLSEREGFWTPSNEQLDNESSIKGGVFDQGSCDESTVAPPFVSHGNLNLCFKQHLKSMEPITATCAPNDGSVGEFADKSLDSASPMESCVYRVDDRTVMSLHCKGQIEGQTDSNRKKSVIVSSESSVDLPPYGDCPRAQSCSFPSTKDGEALHGDDQENSSVCTHPCSVHSRALKPHCLEAHRRRKLKKSNYRKCDPASYYNSGEVSNNDVEMKPVFHSQKLFYTRQRSKRSSFKQKKLFEHCSISPSCETSPDEVIVDSLAKDGIKLEADNLLAALNGANNISCTRRGSNPLYDSEDHPVKLCIKSFKVPELFIEIPANATVGSLKRTVMEAVMAVLGDGLCVGILLQGKKVRDDSKTLRQAGISYEDKMDGLGFTLEPSPAGTPPSILNLKEPAFVLTDPMPLNKFQASDATVLPPPLPPANCIEIDHENSAHSSIDPPDNLDSDSKMLVPWAAANSAGAALSLVPLGKSRRSEIAQQRRIRRPFSVSEVEALVQAVEKLGTGRWRDVKIRAFGDSKHRTYVDLKDKWKTLVHTARISPQQRRGEPVPQELLDRVLSAHAYWSHHQAKLPDPAEPRLLT
ncbi:Telomere repeat-binding protein 3 [Platanthera zijinensis]|uniref:Telomere repeat-binding protein 3 n=1 Tax=Platanthera zijinensis TaxID=2320716 RepID=A0AAP0AY36_9ASPA